MSNTTIDVLGAEFAKTNDCVDLLSFDPGTVNLAVVHLRVDRRQNRFCVLHAALIDISHPLECFLYPQPMAPRARKPARVEPYSSNYPAALRCGTDRPRALVTQELPAQHVALLQTAEPTPLSLMAWALHCVPWIADLSTIDYVLIEAQDPNKAAMRAVQHSIQAYFETRNTCTATASTAAQQLPTIAFVNARLKLSAALVGTLGAHLRFLDTAANIDQKMVAEVAAEGEDFVDSLLALVDRTDHETNKRSTNRVWDWLRKERDFGTVGHRFFAWMENQRLERHNILDSLLQAFAYCLENGIGCAPEHRLDSVRKVRQSTMAKERRKRKKEEGEQKLQEDEGEEKVLQQTKKARKKKEDNNDLLYDEVEIIAATQTN